jgi:hypothetical protein
MGMSEGLKLGLAAASGAAAVGAAAGAYWLLRGPGRCQQLHEEAPGAEHATRAGTGREAPPQAGASRRRLVFSNSQPGAASIDLAEEPAGEGSCGGRDERGWAEGVASSCCSDARCYATAPPSTPGGLRAAASPAAPASPATRDRRRQDHYDTRPRQGCGPACC